jgi:hypothetical protein
MSNISLLRDGNKVSLQSAVDTTAELKQYIAALIEQGNEELVGTALLDAFQKVCDVLDALTTGLATDLELTEALSNLTDTYVLTTGNYVVIPLEVVAPGTAIVGAEVAKFPIPEVLDEWYLVEVIARGNTDAGTVGAEVAFVTALDTFDILGINSATNTSGVIAHPITVDAGDALKVTLDTPAGNLNGMTFVLVFVKELIVIT